MLHIIFILIHKILELIKCILLHIDLRRVMSYYLFNESKQTRIEISRKIIIFQSDSE